MKHGEENRHKTTNKLVIVGCKDNEPIVIEEWGELSLAHIEARVAELRTIQPPGTRIVVVPHEQFVKLLSSLPAMGANHNK